MPSKDQSTTKDILEPINGSSTTHEKHGNIIKKLYGTVIHNGAVSSGVKLIKAKYQGVLVEGLQQIDGLRKIGEGVYISATERVKNWCYSITIYNHLTGLWLVKSLPHNYAKIPSYEEFQESFQMMVIKSDSEGTQRSVKHFYNAAKEAWEKLTSPSLEEIKTTCLQIVAQTVAKDFEIAISSYPGALVEFFSALDNKTSDILTHDAFYYHIRRKFSSEEVNEPNFHRASDLFYTFAKRFAFLEFPLTYANKDLLIVLKKLGKEKFDVTGETILAKVDCLANVLIAKLGIKYEEKEEPVNLIDRFHHVVYKVSVISVAMINRTRDAIQATGTYKYSDKYIHFDDRYKELAGVAQQVYNISLNVLASVSDVVSYTYDKYAKRVVITLYDASSSKVKQSHAYLLEKYSFLKEATLKLKGRVLEIEVSQEAFEKLGNNTKEYFLMFYKEIKTLDSEKVKMYTSKAYQHALELFRSKSKREIVAERIEDKSSEAKESQ